MAARSRRITHDEKTRQKIQTSQLINRLVNHAIGKVEMSATQVRAAEILLKKTLPDLQSIDITAQIDQTINTVSDKPMDLDEWRRKHSVGAATGSASRAH